MIGPLREREREVFIFLGVFPFLKIKGRKKESTNIQCVYLDAIKIQRFPRVLLFCLYSTRPLFLLQSLLDRWNTFF